jgi:hypothetical protein
MKAHFETVGLFERLPKNLKISNSSLQCSPPYVYQLQCVVTPHDDIPPDTKHYSLQYHHTLLLLHRPFFQLLNPGKNSIAYDTDGRDIHSRSVKESAVKIARILQIFRKNYTLVSVHPKSKSQLCKLTIPEMHADFSGTPSFYSIYHTSLTY